VKSAIEHTTAPDSSQGSPSFLLRAARVGFFLASSCLLAGAVLLGLAHADVLSPSSQSGETLMAYPSAPHARTRRMLLNGVQIAFRTQTVADAPGAVLAHYRRLCGIEGAAPSQAAGHVACVDLGGIDGIGALARRFGRFVETGNLSDIGMLRYAHGHRVTSDDGDKTFLFTMWTDSDFDVASLLPSKAADSAGYDPTGVPRLEASRRILSASEADAPSGAFIYLVRSQSPDEVASFYRRALPERGWNLIARDVSESIVIDGVHMVSAERNSRVVTLLSYPGENDHAVLTVLTSEPPW